MVQDAFAHGAYLVRVDVFVGPDIVFVFCQGVDVVFHGCVGITDNLFRKLIICFKYSFSCFSV